MTQKYFVDVNKCQDVRELLSAKLDGEASSSEVVAVRDHLSNCAECVLYESELKWILRSLKDEPPVGFSSSKMWEAIQRDLDNLEDDEILAVGDERLSNGLFKWMATVAVAACLVASILITSVLMVGTQDNPLPVVAETVRDFETFQVRGEILDVEASDTTDVIQWMSAKVDFNLPDTINPPHGFTMSGGRLCSFLNRRLAFFHYMSNSETLSLYVMKGEGLQIPDTGQYETYTTREGLTTVSWKRDDLAFVIVSELPAKEVIRFASRS